MVCPHANEGVYRRGGPSCMGGLSASSLSVPVRFGAGGTGFFFFFQAEDGIRDLIVTGVQTCALPIYLLQQLTTGGKALNTKFNSSGNFGYPPDGGGIGAGSTQIDLRSLDSKRALVLVEDRKSVV